MEDPVKDLTKPLLDVDGKFEFDPKKYVAKRAHQNPDQADGSDGGESLVRSRVRSLSALTDEHEFNDVRKMDPEEYFYLHLWGEMMDDDESEDMNLQEDNTWTAEELIQLKLADSAEKKILKARLTKTHVKKLSDVMVFFTLLKGFIGTGILFLPNGFYNGGYGFAIGSLFCSMIMTLTSMILLIKVSEKTELTSFSELGKRALGKTGKYMCDITLAISQAGFVTAASVFVFQNLAKILSFRLGFEVKHWWIGVFCFIIYSPLTWVRKLQKFARFHVFADFTVLTALFVIICYAVLFYRDTGHFSDEIEPFNHNNYLIFVGTAIYAFEGVGIVLPVKDACQNPQNYVKILSVMIFMIMGIYVTFGGFNYFVYGGELLKNAPLVTRLMPEGSLPIEIVFILFTINIFISFPLVIHPTNIVLESYIFKSVKQSYTRKWLKNICRTCVVATTICLGLYLEESLDRLMSIIGSLACTPVAFMLPALLHYQLAAESTVMKVVDLVIVVISIFLMIFITGYTFMNWNAD